jgi:cytochrome c553
MAIGPGSEVAMKFLLLLALVGYVTTSAHADARAGEKKAQLCVLCHKPNNTMAYVPTLEGQTREYLYAQLKAFKEKRRSDPAMQMNAATLSEKDMRDIADYFASRKPVRDAFQLDSQKIAKGESKAKELQCGTCHMADFSGNKEAPRLAGLHPKYASSQLVAFKSARPHPTVEGLGALSEQDAENLAQYFAQRQ